jgi:RNA polymerase sigma factor (TIGR02999 family)
MTAEPITMLLDAASRGDAAATDALFRAVYAELQKIAHLHRRRWQGNETMNTTALVHEAFLKLAGTSVDAYTNRVHFFATASRAMRQVLVNYAEQQGATKRGGEALRVSLDEVRIGSQATADEVLDLERALARLEREHARRCRIAECRLYGGMTIEETAGALSLSTATVKREWQLAAAQLYRHLESD